MRLGHIEKSVEVDHHQDQEYFTYRATEDGLDMFLRHEEKYADLQVKAETTRRNQLRPGAPAPNPDLDLDDKNSVLRPTSQWPS